MSNANGLQTKDISDAAVCEAYRIFEKQRKIPNCPWPYDHLMDSTGACFKVCYAAMERACHRGFLEYGTSLRSGWLTREGKALLNVKKTASQSSGVRHAVL